MTTQIINNEALIQPVFLLQYETQTESNNVVHRVIGKGEPDVSLAEDTTRMGTLHLFFDTKADAWEAFTLLRDISVWTLSDTDHEEINMDFTRQGVMKITLDSVSRRRWIIEMDYQEIV